MPARLEDMTLGTVVRGVVSGDPVTTVAAEWHGSSCVTLSFRTPGGDVGHQLVYRSAETGLNVEDAGRAWSFGELFRHYDLPWNANRIEQRFGRVRRIGQTEVRHLWNLVADGTARVRCRGRAKDAFDYDALVARAGPPGSGRPPQGFSVDG